MKPPAPRQPPARPSPWRGALAKVVPYVIIARGHAARLRPDDLGLGLRPPALFDPGDVGASAFLDLVERLDGLVYEPRGLLLPRWALYDCSEAPGAVVGFAAPAGELSAGARAALHLGEETPPSMLIPLSSCLLVPMLAKDHLWCNGLVSVNLVSPGAAPAGLRRLSLCYGLASLRAARLYAATQWRSPSVAVYASLGRLRVESAFTLAHARPATLVFHANAPARGWAGTLRTGPSRPRRASRWLDVDDHAALLALQATLERGGRASLVGPPTQEGAAVRVPLGAR